MATEVQITNYLLARLISLQEKGTSIDSILTDARLFYHETPDRIETTKRFSFRDALVNHGCNPSIVADFMKVREKKKGANTITAFNSIVKEAKKAGISLNEAVTIATENEWRSFRAEYIKDQLASKKHSKLMASIFDNNEEIPQ